METVVPFRAWRYASAAGEPARLVAPPYDVIGPDLQSRLYAKHPHNVVRVDLGMTTASDNDCDNQYTRARVQLAQWKESDIIVRDREPAVTFVEENFIGPDGRAKVRHGFLAAMRLHDFDEGVVFPHEETLTGPKEDRFRLMTSTSMSLSPVFMLYELPSDDITRAWRAGPGTQVPAVTITDEKDIVIRLWSTSDPAILDGIGGRLAASRFVIADGHHRYETALRYRDHQRATQGAGAPARPAFEYCLAYFSNMADPALAIYATHRLLAGLDPSRVAALPQTLSDWFTVEPLTSGPVTTEHAQAATAVYLSDHPRRAFAFWGLGFEAVYGFCLEDRVSAPATAPGHSRAYQELDVTILQSLVFEKALGVTSADLAAERFVTYCRDPGEAFALLAAGEFQVGFFLNPTGLDQVKEVALGGERMPQKATFFYPKLPTGLVFHDLTGRL